MSAVHTKAKGTNDTLHYVFSTHGVPTVLVVRTNKTGDIVIKCKDFLSKNMTLMDNSITFTEEHYAYAIMFNRVSEIAPGHMFTYTYMYLFGYIIFFFGKKTCCYSLPFSKVIYYMFFSK